MTRKSFGISGSVDARLDVSGYRAAKREDPIPSDPTGAFREAVTFLQKGRHVGAEARCRYVVEKQPAHGGAWHMLGVLALGKNQPSEALACFEKALASMPENPDILINMGIALTGEGRQDEAIEHFQRAVELRPDHGDGHFNLGIALLHRLDSAGAVRHLGKAARLMPANADAHMNLGLAVLSRDGAAAALGHLREAVRLAPGNATARGNLASALFDINACEESLAEFDQAITLNPTICHIHFGRAKTLNRLRRSRQAVAAYERAIKLDPHFVLARNNLAQVLMQRGRFEDAEDHLRQALAQQPKEREIRLNLAALLAATGRVGEATIQCESLEQEHPDWFDAYLMHISILQEAGEFARAREIIAILRELTSDPCIRLQAAAADHDIEISDRDLQGAALAVEEGRLPEKNAGRICFILGRTFERRGEYDRSFGFYRRGNEIRNREHEYDAVTVSGRNNRLMDVFDAAFFAERGDQGLADDRPIFIVGMMRSGTSLVEQIIASHRHAAGAGELTDFPFLSQELAELLKTGREYPECVRDFDPARAQAFAKIYLNRQARFFPDARRITDKMPINFMHLGLIVHMFPRARIIHCQRDPRDICISILSQSFGGYHPYAYDQKRLAHFYGEYLRLMDHWKRVLPAKILDLKYEDMVGSTEACARRVLDFCGLDWDDDCLRFHETRRAVHTASSWQVRQPVYGSSVGRWRRFENHLSPLIREFRKLGIELDRPDSDPPRTEERIIDEP